MHRKPHESHVVHMLLALGILMVGLSQPKKNSQLIEMKILVWFGCCFWWTWIFGFFWDRFFFWNFFFFSISPCGCFWILTTSSYLYLAFLYIEPAHPYCKWLLFFVPGSKFFWVNVFSLSLSPSLILKHLAFTFDENFPWPVK